MDQALRDRRLIVAAMVWGAELERSADQTARRLTPRLNARDVLLLAALTFDLDGRALPGNLIGPVHNTSAGVTGSLRRLEQAGLVARTVGADARTRPVTLTEKGRELVLEIVEPWQEWFEERLGRIDGAERADLYRLLVKASGLWDGVWPAEYAPADRSRTQRADSDLGAASAPSHATNSSGCDGRSGGR